MKKWSKESSAIKTTNRQPNEIKINERIKKVPFPEASGIRLRR